MKIPLSIESIGFQATRTTRIAQRTEPRTEANHRATQSSTAWAPPAPQLSPATGSPSVAVGDVFRRNALEMADVWCVSIGTAVDHWKSSVFGWHQKFDDVEICSEIVFGSISYTIS